MTEEVLDGDYSVLRLRSEGMVFSGFFRDHTYRSLFGLGSALVLILNVTERKDADVFVRPHDVDIKGEAGVKGVDDSQNLRGLFSGRDRGSYQCLLDGAALSRAVPGRGIPAGRGDDLVTGYFPF